MENKNTKELRGYKAGLKSKLMGAVAMLLVSAIMVSSATYAWFVLSTHPEVKGMSTTVGSNGALEIALLNNETGKDPGTVTAGVGDSAKGVTESNETWGNIVDLSTSYGLAGLTLYPAVLNYDNANSVVADRTSLLKYASYGTDGRVSALKRDTVSGLYEANTGFVSDSSIDPYGVRGIGTAGQVDPFKKAFADAVNGYNRNAASAKDQAAAAFSDNLSALVNLSVLHGTDDELKFKPAQYACIGKALDALNGAVETMETALKYAIAAKINMDIGNNESPDKSQLLTIDDVDNEDKNAIERIDLSTYVENSEYGYGQYIRQLAQLKTDIAATQAKFDALNNAEVEWSTLRPPYADLMGLDGQGDEETQVSVNGANCSIDDLKSKATELVDPNTVFDVIVKSGLFKDMADVTGEMRGSVQTIVKGNGTVAAKSPTLKEATDGIVGEYSAPTGEDGASAAIITTAYGYAVDLAFKTNAANNDLQLSGETSRIKNNTDANVQGNGSTFTFTYTGTPPTKADMQKIAKALRVVFVDKDLKVVAVAAIDQADGAIKEGTYEYALHIYKATFTKDGGIELGAAVENDKIMTLEQDTATALSAIVYLDGENVDYAMNGVTGTLNLQFCGSADLSPMTYDFSASSDDTTAGGDTGNTDTP